MVLILNTFGLRAQAGDFEIPTSGNGDFTTYDLLQIRRCVLGLSVDFGAGWLPWRFVPWDGYPWTGADPDDAVTGSTSSIPDSIAVTLTATQTYILRRFGASSVAMWTATAKTAERRFPAAVKTVRPRTSGPSSLPTRCSLRIKQF